MNRIDTYLSLLASDDDGLLLTGKINRRYCAGYDVDEGVAIITRKGCRYLTDSRYLEAAQQHLEGFEICLVDRARPYLWWIKDTAAAFSLRRLGYEENVMRASAYLRYVQELPVELYPAQAAMDGFRMAKSSAELEELAAAQRITDAAFSSLLPKIQPGLTERQLASELICCLYQNGAEGLSFPPIVVSGPNTSLPHGVPGVRQLQKGDFVTMDFGVIFGGYCSDMTRTVALGSATAEMRRVYDTVLAAQLAGIEASRAGVRGCDVDAAARRVIEEAGYGDCFGHSYGHGVGLEIHEAPNCSPGNQEPIPAGAVCSAEPGIYLPGKFGVRIEDVVVFQPDGCRILTESPKNLLIL